MSHGAVTGDVTAKAAAESPTAVDTILCEAPFCFGNAGQRRRRWRRAPRGRLTPRA